jgi:hypothetical protein
MGVIKINWPIRILARSQRLPGGAALLKICERDEVLREFQARMRVGAKPVTALSAPLLKELPEEQVRAHPFKQLAGEATAFVCESILHAVRGTGGRAILGDPLFSSGTSFRERGTVQPPDVDEGASCLAILQGMLATMSDGSLAILATSVAAEQENRR